jgi:exopolyphosphatase / guanosine-5'-triphosphate,3'-diphosphate pyrophosphatase
MTQAFWAEQCWREKRRSKKIAMPNLPPQRRAVIDVGTNSVKLLVADISDSEVTPVCEESKQTRLGRGFYKTHLLQADAISATAEAVKKYSAQAKTLEVKKIRVIATSAARDALNASDLLSAIKISSGLGVEIISGEQEADWAFEGVASDPKLASFPLLIIDVGGGSTEFILGEGRHQHFRNSFRLGTVRLLEFLQPGDPPGLEALARCRNWLKDFLGNQIAPELEPAIRGWDSNIQLVGTGGTTTILARMEKQLPIFDREQIESARLTLAQVRAHVERTWNISLEERKKIIGLPPKRADVILTGLAIYEAVMARFGFDELRISTRGLRYAAVLHK